MSTLQLTELRKSYGSTLAVDGVSLELNPGEVLGLLGPNGAGKSTTIGMCVGLLAPDSGSVEFASNRKSVSGPPSDPEVRRNMGVAPQSLALYEELSAQENLYFFGQVQGLRSKDLPGRVEWALELAGLGDVRFDPVSSYSGGMKRRLNLAVAVIHQPELVLLDEPTVGVDPQSRNAILQRVERFREDGQSVLYTTHYMEEAQRLCDRIAIVDHGKLVEIDTVDGLIEKHGGAGTLTVMHEHGKETLATNEPVDALNGLRQTLRVETFRYDPPNLEGVFLNLTGRALRD